MEAKGIDQNAENIKIIKSIIGDDVSEDSIDFALMECNNNVDAAINEILDKPGFYSPQILVSKKATSTGARVSAQIKVENAVDVEELKALLVSKSEERGNGNPEMGSDGKVSVRENVAKRMSFDDFLRATNTKVDADEEYLSFQNREQREKDSKAIVKVKEEPDVGPTSLRSSELVITPNMTFEEYCRLTEGKDKPNDEKINPQIKEEKAEEKSIVLFDDNVVVKEETKEPIMVQPLSSRPPSVQNGSMYDRLKPSNVKKHKKEEDNRVLSTIVIEDGDFPQEPDWLLVGRTAITGLSITKGRKLENNEIVHLAFPSGDSRSKYRSPFVSTKAAAAVSGIVRFSTTRSGEIGRLSMEWAKCLVPLVNSSKVKVLCRCIAASTNLHLMQDVLLYASFYIHKSVVTEGDKSSWRLDSPSNIDSTVYPILTLFRLLKTKPYQEAAFTPEELHSRKRVLNLEGDSAVLPVQKRGKGCQPDQNNDEQAITESALNELVGAAAVYNLEEMEPPCTFMCDLRPYQKQALYWMSESEKGADVEKAAKMLHPCWAAYRICDERVSSIYVNIFSGEATTKFPAATQMARGGILADAMGLGKTVMTISLILVRPSKGSPDTKQKRDSDGQVLRKVRGGTLIICPMALLGQWKDELNTHSKPGSISIFVHYGGDRSNNPKIIEEADVVLTTYGVLSAAYKNDADNSIFHRVDWYRVVLDEAHAIKSARTQGAQAAFSLSSYCRWCLTGTPLQNNLEDLYSLLCFLHVEPWCNWAWWHKLIQRPYENGDQRGLKLIKAILRPLMLRRTKDTRDKYGRSILVLPPTDIQVIECDQSEAEHHFYSALFRRSKVQFDQFVAQGKVLHNYANILELLLRLRQCCNHPYLVMSRSDSQEYADLNKRRSDSHEYADLNKLARRFLETNADSYTSSKKVPSRAYVEEVVEGIRRGENTECPICLESADDPVLTPCAHRMCRECLLSSWQTPATGPCPICRQLLNQTDLITCPSKPHYRIDVDNWEESSKVLKLMDCLERIRRSGSGEKSIVFSQWTSFLDLLEIPLRRRKIGFLRFDGKLAQKQREKVLKEFSESNEKVVMLMSLRAGGVGLNLTSASNVFLMDPWWNPAVEEQAIMRIHRIGQKRTVHVRRFIVKDTVEHRLQQVQARKQGMIAGALTDEEVRSARIEELEMLFR